MLHQISFLWQIYDDNNNNNNDNNNISKYQKSRLSKVSNFLWLVVSTHLKNIRQNGNPPQIGMKIKKIELPPQPVL